MESSLIKKEKDITETGKDHEKMYKEPITRSIGLHRNYAIFKAGKKIKDFKEIEGFLAYMYRRDGQQVIDELKTRENKVILGGEDLEHKLRYHLRDVKIKKNAVLGREILLSASPAFFKGITDYELARWIQSQKDFMYQNFGNNLLFMIVHLDRSTPHIHAVVSFKTYDTLKEKYFLRHYEYFNGKKMLAEWQDRYAAAMSKDFDLHRGIQSTKIRPIELETFYGILQNPTIDLKPEEAVKKAQLLDLMLKNAEKKIDRVQLINDDLRKENSKILEQAMQINKSNNIYQSVIESMIKKYGEKEISKMLLVAETSKQQNNLSL